MVKKGFYKLFTLILAFTFVLSSAFGCAQEKADNHPVLPDYSSRAKEFDFFAYSGPMSGTFTRNGEQVVLGPDQRTTEGYTVFKDAGFNIAFLSGSTGFGGGNWATSECKRAVDAAKSVGIDRFIVFDSRLSWLSEFKDNLVGNGEKCKFQNDEELYSYVLDCVDDYMLEETFYGIALRDEPDYIFVGSLGKIYRAIKRAGQELGLDYVYIHLTLVGYGSGDNYFGKKEQNDFGRMYVNNYLRAYLESTGADRLNCDFYIARERSSGNYLGAMWNTIRIMREVCAEYGAKISFCLQSFELFDGKTPKWRRVNKSDMMLEMYTLIGHGVSEFAYYTYQPAETFGGTNWRSMSCFMTEAGELTNIYYYGQELMSGAQAMSDVILNYEFQGSRVYTAPVANFSNSHCLGDKFLDGEKGDDGQWKIEPLAEWLAVNSHEFKLVKNVKFDNDVVLVSELYDDVEDLYMYMIQNIIDPTAGHLGETSEMVEVTFDSSYTHVAEFKDGRLEYVKLSGGVYKKTLSAGHAVFLIPLK